MANPPPQTLARFNVIGHLRPRIVRVRPIQAGGRTEPMSRQPTRCRPLVTAIGAFVVSFTSRAPG
jgi:hypothetical protein